MIPPPIQPDVIGTASILKGRTPEIKTPFREHLAGEQRAHDARTAAEEFVAAAFIEPILAQLRETNRAAGPFAPTAAEKRFGPLLDQRIAHDVVRGARFPLVDRLERQLQPKLGGDTNHVA